MSDKRSRSRSPTKIKSRSRSRSPASSIAGPTAPANAQPTEIDNVSLILAREAARAEKDWTKADAFRQTLKERGVEIFDSQKKWKGPDGIMHDIMGGFDPMTNQVLAPVDKNEVRALVDAREDSRAAKDWENADKIRDLLKTQGVTIYDKERLWKTADGHVEIITKYQGQVISDPSIQMLVDAREEAREAKNWSRADEIRDLLRSQNVTLHDKQKIWQHTDGRRGAIRMWSGASGPSTTPFTGVPQMQMGYSVPGFPSETDIGMVVLQREQARQRRDFKTADTLRDTLKQLGVTLDDKSKTWVAADGRTGAIPLYDSFSTNQGYQGMAVATDQYGMMAMQQQAVMQQQVMGADQYQQQMQQYQLQQQQVQIAQQQQFQAQYAQFGQVQQPAPAAATGAATAVASADPNADISLIVAQREQARARHDWTTADQFREVLRAMGVTCDDKAKTWSTTDGRTGSIPMHSSMV